MACHLFGYLPTVFSRCAVNFSAHQLAEQQVACEWRCNHIGGDDVVLESRLSAAGGDEAGLVRVVVVDVDDSVVTAFEDVGYLELEVPALVPAKCKAGNVVTLYQHPVRDRDTLVD
jgi:hypothetical protein